MAIFVESDEKGFIAAWWDVPHDEYLGKLKIPRRPEGDDWMNGDKLEKRPRMSIIVDGSRIDGVPHAATVTIEDQTFTADGGRIEIEGYSGEVHISLWPYMDEVVTL